MAKSKHQSAEKTPVIPHEPEQQPDEEGRLVSPITRDERSSSSFGDWDAGCIRMFTD
ncbi:TPA: hypothetical protein QDB04_000122 [Burkholderia vietnamiensis]|nr:hypothetical protein [Burkholderia vietnamiensis]